MDKLKRVIFFDRDNTIIDDIPYNTNPGLISIKPYVIETLQELSVTFEFIIITNQSGAARGLITIGQIELFMQHLLALFSKSNVTFLDYYYSPYFFTEASENIFSRQSFCRKPGPLLIELAAREHKVDLAHSFFVGDRLSDVGAALNAGVQPVLIGNTHYIDYNSNAKSPELIQIPDFRMLIDVVKQT